MMDTIATLQEKPKLCPLAPENDSLGYFNPIDKEYHHTVFSHFLEKAAEEYKKAKADKHTPKPYHLVLDEMNLARSACKVNDKNKLEGCPLYLLPIDLTVMK
jgi:hypothetical protein